MGLFSSKKQPLTTSYGYQPPANATAWGWQCNNVDCGTGDSPAPKKWPSPCPRSGGPVDPDFDEPWAEEARGYRLKMLGDRDGDEYGTFEAGHREWSYGRALASGDVAGAEALRVETNQWLVDKRGTVGNTSACATRGAIIGHALRYGQTDAAASELNEWFELIDVYNFDAAHLGESSSEGNDARVTAWSVLTSAFKFLGTPGAKSNALVPAIDKATRHLGSATRHEMWVDMSDQLDALLRTVPPA